MFEGSTEKISFSELRTSRTGAAITTVIKAV